MSLYDGIKFNKNYNPANSVQWFRKNVTNAFSNLGQMQFLGLHQQEQSTKIVPGVMAFFGYDAKTKDTLPYWDQFPLILPFQTDAKYFHGINLHYLPYPQRILILDKLLSFKQNRTIIPDKKIQLSWEMLKAVSMHKAVNHSVKKYLHGQVKTRFVAVKTDDWVIASQLPMSNFKKATESDVWRDI